MPIIKIAEPARNDLEEIWQYVAENNPQAAGILLSELKSKFILLSDEPYLGRQRPELLLNLRAFPHKKYIIFYFPTDKGIEIFRVLHSSRDISAEFDDTLPDDAVN